MYLVLNHTKFLRVQLFDVYNILYPNVNSSQTAKP